MKKLLVPFFIICLGLAGLQAQNQSTDEQKNQVIVKKITIQNVDGQETRTETVDTFDASTWDEESLQELEYNIIIKDADNIEFVPSPEAHAVIVNPEHFQMQWNEAMEEERKSVTPPNKAVLGVQLNNVDGDNGAQIVELFVGSAAEKAGLQEGDILLSIDGKETNNVEEVISALSDNKPGDKVKIKFLRGTKVKDTRIILQERKEEMVSMKHVAGCKPKMKCCKPGEMKECKPLDDKMRQELEKELKELGGMGEGKQKMIIINKKPGEVKILRNNGTGSNEIIKRGSGNQNKSEAIINKNYNQSLNVEYLTSSPNPSNGQMKISFSGLAIPTSIQVLDLNGKEVYNEKLDNFDGYYNKEIDIKNDAKGTLILKIIQGDKIMTQKIIVE